MPFRSCFTAVRFLVLSIEQRTAKWKIVWQSIHVCILTAPSRQLSGNSWSCLWGSSSCQRIHFLILKVLSHHPPERCMYVLITDQGFLLTLHPLMVTTICTASTICGTLHVCLSCIHVYVWHTGTIRRVWAKAGLTGFHADDTTSVL